MTMKTIIPMEYEIKSVKDAIKIIEYLAGGDILGWKSVRDVAEKTGTKRDKTHRLLLTLKNCGWVEQSKHGFRQNTDGLMRHLQYGQKYMARLAKQYGVKARPGL